MPAVQMWGSVLLCALLLVCVCASVSGQRLPWMLQESHALSVNAEDQQSGHCVCRWLRETCRALKMSWLRLGSVVTQSSPGLGTSMISPSRPLKLSRYALTTFVLRYDVMTLLLTGLYSSNGDNHIIGSVRPAPAFNAALSLPLPHATHYSKQQLGQSADSCVWSDQICCSCCCCCC